MCQKKTRDGDSSREKFKIQQPTPLTEEKPLRMPDDS